MKQHQLSDTTQKHQSWDLMYRAALEKASDNAELAELLGLPLHPGPWYNASMSLTHKANIANCQFALVGTKNSSDVHIRVCLTHHV